MVHLERRDRSSSFGAHVHLDARERRDARAWGTRAIVVGVAAIVISLAIGFTGVIGWRKPSVFAGGGLGAIYIGWRRRRDLRG